MNKDLKEFLWSISGFKKDVISNCSADSYHAQIIGTLLFVVGVYSTLAWTFFFQSVGVGILLSLGAGIFMAFFIVSLDKSLIASMSTGRVNLFSFGFRMILAFLLGIFLSQPMILKFYQNDINREAKILIDRKNKERKKELQSLYKSDIDLMTDQNSILQTEKKNKINLINQSEIDFKQEMDGSGGTTRWGYNEVAKRKESILKQHQQDLDSLQTKIDKIQSGINEINDIITAEVDKFIKENPAHGALVQTEALYSLLDKDKTGNLELRFYLLSFILTLIELSALIAKMLFETKSYRSQMQAITDKEVKSSENDKEISLGKLDETKRLMMETELNIIKEFFDKTSPVNSNKLDELVEEWKKDAATDKTYKDLWESFRGKLLIHE